MKRLRLPVITGLASCSLAVVLMTGCGGNGASSTSPTAAGKGVDQKIVAELPAAIKAQGTLTVATDATYAPNEFIGANGKTIEGMSPDLGHALGQLMDLDFHFVNASFDSIIPGLSSGKYDLGFSSFTDTKEREQVVDFVTYFSAGTSFYVQAAGGPTINSLADLCGHSVGVERGTIQADDTTKQSTECKAAGKPGVDVHVYPDQNAANLAISSGRQEVGMADSPVAAYIVKKSNGQFKLTGQPYNTAPYGIAVPKGNGMAKPLLDAMKELIADGTYAKILKKWGTQAGAITNPVINGAIS
jgi:polar amino acid transport system substrate-binding protein